MAGVDIVGLRMMTDPPAVEGGSRLLAGFVIVLLVPLIRGATGARPS